MQQTTATAIKNGFLLNYTCDACGTHIYQENFFIPELVIIWALQYNLQKCPICLTEIEINFCKIKNYIKGMYWAPKYAGQSTRGIGFMTINQNFIID
jgi:hypothetical protein